MALIHVYNSVTNEHSSIKGTGKLKNILPDYDFSHCIALSKGNRINGDYYAGENEIIYLRTVPSSSVAIAVVAVVCAVVAIGVGVGAAIYANKMSEEAKEKMEKAQRDANNLASKTENLPFLKGARNRKALGNQIQFLLGEMYNTPYLLTDGYYSIEGTNGTKQYWNAILCLGYKSQLIKQLRIGTENIKDFSSATTPQNGVYNFDSTSIYYDANNLIEIRQGAAFTNECFKKKVVSTENGNEIKHDYGKEAEPFIIQLASNTKTVEVCIQFSALRQYDSEHGNWEARSVQVNPYWSNDGGETWHLFYFNETNTFTANSKSTLRYKATYEFSYEEAFDKDITVKLVRSTPKKESNSNEDVFLLYYNSFCFDRQKSYDEEELIDCTPVEDWYQGKCTMVGLRIIANESTSSILDEINVTASGVARVWNNSRWSSTKQPTRNPAAWLLELLTTQLHPHSAFTDEEIDLDAFGALYEYCETNSLHTDGIVTAAVKKRDILTQILETVFANMYMDSENRITVCVDKPETLPVALLNGDCVRSIKVAKNFSRQSDGVKINFTNRENWAIDTTYIMMDGATRTEESTLTEQSIEFATEYEHIYKIAQRKLRTMKLQPREITVDVGKEGDYYPIFSLVALQLKELKIGITSSVIREVHVNSNTGNINYINISDYVVFEENKRYGVIIQAQNQNGFKLIYKEVEGTGKTRKLTFTVPFIDTIMPQLGNVVSFGLLDDEGEFSTITNLMKIMATEPNGDDGYSLSLVDYNPAIYETGEIPEYKSNLTKTPESYSGISPALLDSFLAPLRDSAIDTASGTFVPNPEAPTQLSAIPGKDSIKFDCQYISAGLSNNIKKIEWQIKRPSDEGYIDVSGDEYFFDRETDGYPEAEDLASWLVRCRAVNIYDKCSSWANPEYVTTTGYGTWELQQPSVYIRISDRTIILINSQPSRGDGREVYGAVRYRLQIRRPDVDIADTWYKPATSLDPYPSRNASGEIISGNENNYKDGTGFVYSTGTYVQTMPLAGQAVDSLKDTVYQFKIIAENEAGLSAAQVINVTALCTNIKDIVKANEDFKELYISDLSVLSANIGTISQGALGDGSNLWDLSTFTDDQGVPHYKGRFYAGGVEQYIHVEPVLVNNIPTGEYNITLKVGNFEISSTASSINGTLVIQESETSLDRTRITPNGTYHEHRETTDSNWGIISSFNTNGTMTKQIFSPDTIVVTNQDMVQRRQSGYDVGNAYLSSNSKVYHFDNDVKDQNQTDDLTIIDKPSDGFHNLVGRENNSADINFTPAILAVAPYATEGKSLYGKYSLSKVLGITNNCTVDFWVQYIYAENQILFSIGNQAENVELVVRSKEPYFEKGESDVSGVPFNEEIKLGRLFRKLETKSCFFNEPAEGEIAFNAPGNDEPPFETPAKKEFRADYQYYEKRIEEGVERYERALVTASNYYAKLETGLYEKTVAFNSPMGARSYLRHYGISQSSIVELSEIGIVFESNSWLHIGFCMDSNSITIFLNDKKQVFERYTSSAFEVNVSLNPSQNTFLLDELMLDSTVKETASTFYEHTINRVPWANLSMSQDYFILTAKDLQNFKTNIFDTDIFKQKVLEIINEYHS